MLRSPRRCASRPPFFRALFRRGLVPFAQLVVEPGPCERPVAVRGAAGNAQSGGRLLLRESREEPELDQLGTGRILLRQLLQGLAQREDVVGRFVDGEIDASEAQAPPAAA